MNWSWIQKYFLLIFKRFLSFSWKFLLIEDVTLLLSGLTFEPNLFCAERNSTKISAIWPYPILGHIEVYYYIIIMYGLPTHNKAYKVHGNTVTNAVYADILYTRSRTHLNTIYQLL